VYYKEYMTLSLAILLRSLDEDPSLHRGVTIVFFVTIRVLYIWWGSKCIMDTNTLMLVSPSLSIASSF